MDKIRVTSDADDNLRLDPDPGSLLATDTKLTPADVTVVGSAYTNSSFAAFANRPTATMLFAYDTSGKKDRLWLQNPANAWTVTNPLSTGLDLGTDVGFDIAGAENRGYVAGHAVRALRRTALQPSTWTTGKTRQLGRIGEQRRRDRARCLGGPVEKTWDRRGRVVGAPARPRRTGNRQCPANPSALISRVLPRTEAASTAGFDDEAALVARLATGDREEALAALYDVYGRRLYTLGVHLLHDRGLAEDLVQETFVRLWRSAERYDPRRSSVRTFIYTLARRAAVDLWRRSSRAPSAIADTPETEDGVGGAAFDEVVLRLDVGEALDTRRPPTARCSSSSTTATSRKPRSRSGSVSPSARSRRARCTRCVHCPAELKERGLVD